MGKENKGSEGTVQSSGIECLSLRCGDIVVPQFTAITTWNRREIYYLGRRCKRERERAIERQGFVGWTTGSWANRWLDVMDLCLQEMSILGFDIAA